MNETPVKRALNPVRDGQEITAATVVEGSPTLLEAGIQLELLGRYWLRLHQLGWTLAHPIKGGSSRLVEPEGWQE